MLRSRIHRTRLGQCLSSDSARSPSACQCCGYRLPFNSLRYKDVSLNNWMALTPPDLVRGHLNLDETAMKALKRERCAVVR
jgi:hypothetical protein